jgi:hypothetical protein
MAGRLALIGLLAAYQMGCWHASSLDSDAGVGGDTDADANTDSDCTGPGVWHDESSNLCWQDPPPSGTYTWSNAISYCNDLLHGGHTDWRLPNIDELISLLHGCVDGAETGDLSPSTCVMTPAGCAATENCDGMSNCSWCSHLDGPGAGGCFWDPALSGTCEWYWSSSSRAGSESAAWFVNFDGGSVGSDGKTSSSYDRCVRSGP